MPRNRIFALLAVALVIIGSAVVLAARRGGGGGAQPKQVEQPDQRVIVALVDIPRNAKIMPEMLDINKMVTAKEKSEKFAEALLNPEKIVGGVALTAISKDSPIKAADLKAPPESVSQKVTPGYVAVTIAAPEKPSLYDLKFLKPDDRVDVMGVTYDEKGNWTTSTPLAANVRVLAVDTVWDKFKEEMRRKRVQAEIDQLVKERDEKAKAPGATADSTKALDEAIKSKREELDPKFENPSVTVEVTSAISQLLALWRTSPRTTVKVALHAPLDAQGMLFGDMTLAAPGSAAPAARPTSAPGTTALNLAAAGGSMPTVLSMDDVVPLLQRDPKQYAELLEVQKNVQQARIEGDVRRSQADLDIARNTAQAYNWRKYRREAPPDASLVGGGQVPPLVVPRPTGPETPAVTEKPKPQPPSRYSAPIEVYRGSQVSVVGS